jgi:hypothetical protein
VADHPTVIAVRRADETTGREIKIYLRRTLRESHDDVVEDLGKMESAGDSRALAEASDGSLDDVVVVEGGKAEKDEGDQLRRRSRGNERVKSID